MSAWGGGTVPNWAEWTDRNVGQHVAETVDGLNKHLNNFFGERRNAATGDQIRFGGQVPSKWVAGMHSSLANDKIHTTELDGVRNSAIAMHPDGGFGMGTASTGAHSQLANYEHSSQAPLFQRLFAGYSERELVPALLGLTGNAYNVFEDGTGGPGPALRAALAKDVHYDATPMRTRQIQEPAGGKIPGVKNSGYNPDPNHPERVAKQYLEHKDEVVGQNPTTGKINVTETPLATLTFKGYRPPNRDGWWTGAPQPWQLLTAVGVAWALYRFI